MTKSEPTILEKPAYLLHWDAGGDKIQLLPILEAADDLIVCPAGSVEQSVRDDAAHGYPVGAFVNGRVHFTPSSDPESHLVTHCPHLPAALVEKWPIAVDSYADMAFRRHVRRGQEWWDRNIRKDAGKAFLRPFKPDLAPYEEKVGLPFPIARAIAKSAAVNYPDHQLNPKAVLALDDAAEQAILDAFIAEGLAERTEKGVEPTLAGRALAGKTLRRIKKKTAFRLRDEVLARARAIANDPAFVFEVKRLYFFGSINGPEKEDYGDIDVAVELTHKPAYKNRGEAYEHHDAMTGRAWCDFSNTPERIVKKHLRNRSAHVSVHNVEEIEKMGFPMQLAYEKETA